MTLDEQLELLAKYPAAVKAAAANAEDRLVDVLGIVSSNQAAIKLWKRGTTSETSDGERGQRWFAKQGGSYERSYNTTGLLALIAKAMDWTLPQTLNYLLFENVIAIEWKWAPRTGLGLKKFLRDNNILAFIIKREVEDGDEKYHIGEWWKPGYMSYKPIPEDDDNTGT